MCYELRGSVTRRAAGIAALTTRCCRVKVWDKQEPRADAEIAARLILQTNNFAPIVAIR